MPARGTKDPATETRRTKTKTCVLYLHQNHASALRVRSTSGTRRQASLRRSGVTVRQSQYELPGAVTPITNNRALTSAGTRSFQRCTRAVKFARCGHGYAGIWSGVGFSMDLTNRKVGPHSKSLAALGPRNLT